MNVLFFGTPDIAASILDGIAGSRHNVSGVVTREDKPKGRGKELSMPPVKELALNKNIDVFQPSNVKDKESVEKLKSFNADIFVVAAYGSILSKEILDIPKYGCINVHASLLPKYRGAAPIQWAIINGEKLTGVTIMQMNEGLDTGDMLFKTVVEISDDDTAESLHDKLCTCGKSLIIEALDKIEAGDIHPIKQEASQATYAKILTKADGHLSFHRNADEIERHVRGLYPWPGTYAYIHGKMLKIYEVKVLDDIAGEAAAGHITDVDGRLVVAAKDKLIELVSIQLEGKKRMMAKDFLRGYKVSIGDMLE